MYSDNTILTWFDLKLIAKTSSFYFFIKKKKKITLSVTSLSNGLVNVYNICRNKLL